MKTDNQAVLADRMPSDLDRLLRGAAQLDDFADTRPALARLFGPAWFEWETGWLTVDRASRPFVHLSAWHPKMLAQARDLIGSRFVIARVEAGCLTRRRRNAFMTVVISGRRDPGV